jgi:hypothetical protein
MSEQLGTDWEEDGGSSDGHKKTLEQVKTRTRWWFKWIQFFGVLEALAIASFLMLWILTFSTNKLTNFISLSQSLHVATSLVIIIALTFFMKSKPGVKLNWAKALLAFNIANVVGGAIGFVLKLVYSDSSLPPIGVKTAIIDNPTKVEITSFVVTCVALVVAVAQFTFSIFYLRGLKVWKKMENPKKGNQPVSSGGAPFYPSSSGMNKQYWGGKTSYSSINALDNASFQTEPSSFNMRM